MTPRKIQTGIHWVGAVDWDRRLSDDLIPLPDGTSYNAYLIEGSEKTALIDTVDPTMWHVLLNHLDHLSIPGLCRAEDKEFLCQTAVS
jgi:flavorubredoxin